MPVAGGESSAGVNATGFGTVMMAAMLPSASVTDDPIRIPAGERRFVSARSRSTDRHHPSGRGAVPLSPTSSTVGRVDFAQRDPAGTPEARMRDITRS
jgi:hypothetical protein